WLADYQPGSEAKGGDRAPAAESKSAAASRWTRFRGPNGTGVSNDRHVPVAWTPEGILWSVPLPGAGNSSPVLWGERVFVRAAAPDGGERALLCLDAASGKQIWSRSVSGRKVPINPRNTLASSTPAVDGERVYAIFWDGARQELAAFDHAGNPVW